jgi:hypothetical protein
MRRFGGLQAVAGLVKKSAIIAAVMIKEVYTLVRIVLRVANGW